jgi:hypothetical protein
MPNPPSSGKAAAGSGNTGCLVLFGVPFALVGIGMGASALLQMSHGSILSQDTVVRLILSVIFSAAGIVLAIRGVAGRRIAQRAQALAAENPDKPWLWREDWARGSAEPDSKSQTLTFGLMGALFLLVSAPVFLNLRRELFERHNYTILVALIFPLAGLFLIGQACLGRMRVRKFGGTFVMAQVPGVVGGRLSGRIETRFTLPPEDPVDLTLSCVRSYVSGSGNSRSRWENILWQDKSSGSPALGAVGSSLAVDFEVPFDSRETDSKNPDDQIFWRLTATRKLPGIDFDVSFQVPVFKTAASDQSLTADKIEEEGAAHLPAGPPAGSKIRVRSAPEGGVQFYFGPARNKGMAAGLMVFGLIFLASGIFFGVAVGRAFSRFIAVIPLLAAGGIGVLLLALSSWLWLSTATATIANQELRVRWEFLGLARSRLVGAAEIQKFELYPGMQSGNQVWYDLKVHLQNGRSVTAASGLGKLEGEWLEAQMKINLGIS